MEPTIYFVIPCYNEEAVLPETTRRLAEKLQAMQSAGLIGKDSRVLYVDDGSKDKTWQLISQFHQEYPWVEGVKLAHNRGHQNALLCGLMTAKDRCDAAISMDADLQDDTDALDQFVTKFREGCDVVYGVRKNRIPVTMHLTNGVPLKGIIRGFDSYVVLLESDGKQQMIFKHAISTVTPSRPVQYSPSESDVPANPSEEEI